MSRFFECPDTAQFTELSAGRLRCRVSSTDTTSLWVELDSVDVSNLEGILISLNDFDPIQIASFVTFYLVLFIIGYGAGTVVRLLKRI